MNTFSEISRDFEIPNDLSELGHKAAEVIIKTARDHIGKEASGGGCRAFYSPEEWTERGESFGTTSELVVVHDGGDLATMFSYMYGNVDLQESVSRALEEIGCWYESCTCWYTAIYKS